MFPAYSDRGGPRAVSSVIGVALLVAVTVLVAAAMTLALPRAPADPPPQAALDATANATADRVVLVHRGGDALAVEALTVRIEVNGQPIAHQPPVPFFAATGFESGPTGPFNVAADAAWTAGERAGLELAGTNAPLPDPGDAVTVRVYSDGRKVAEVTATA